MDANSDTVIWFGSLVATSLVTGLIARFFSRSEKAEDSKVQAASQFRGETLARLERVSEDIRKIDRLIAGWEVALRGQEEAIKGVKERAEKQADKHAEAVDRLTRELENLRREK